MICKRFFWGVDFNCEFETIKRTYYKLYSGIILRNNAFFHVLDTILKNWPGSTLNNGHRQKIMLNFNFLDHLAYKITQTTMTMLISPPLVLDKQLFEKS